MKYFLDKTVIPKNSAEEFKEDTTEKMANVGGVNSDLPKRSKETVGMYMAYFSMYVAI